MGCEGLGVILFVRKGTSLFCPVVVVGPEEEDRELTVSPVHAHHVVRGFEGMDNFCRPPAKGPDFDPNDVSVSELTSFEARATQELLFLVDFEVGFEAFGMECSRTSITTGQTPALQTRETEGHINVLLTRGLFLLLLMLRTDDVLVVHDDGRPSSHTVIQQMVRSGTLDARQKRASHGAEHVILVMVVVAGETEMDWTFERSIGLFCVWVGFEARGVIEATTSRVTAFHSRVLFFGWSYMTDETGMK